MTEFEIKKLLIEKLIKYRFMNCDDVLENDSNLVELGIDSMGLINIIVEIEEVTGILVADDELLMANFLTPSSFYEFFSGQANSDIYES